MAHGPNMFDMGNLPLPIVFPSFEFKIMATKYPKKATTVGASLRAYTKEAIDRQQEEDKIKYSKHLELKTTQIIGGIVGNATEAAQLGKNESDYEIDREEADNSDIRERVAVWAKNNDIKISWPHDVNEDDGERWFIHIDWK